MAQKPVKNIDPHDQLLFTGHSPKGLWSRKTHAGVRFCVYVSGKDFMFNLTTKTIARIVIGIIAVGVVGLVKIPQSKTLIAEQHSVAPITQSALAPNTIPATSDQNNSDPQKITELQKQVDDLKKQNNKTAPKKSVAPPAPDPIPTQELTPQQPTPAITIYTWEELESKYFAEADQKGWVTLIITNNYGEKRYYIKSNNQWIRKNNQADLDQFNLSIITPTPSPKPTPTPNQHDNSAEMQALQQQLSALSAHFNECMAKENEIRQQIKDQYIAAGGFWTNSQLEVAMINGMKNQGYADCVSGSSIDSNTYSVTQCHYLNGGYDCYGSNGGRIMAIPNGNGGFEIRQY